MLIRKINRFLRETHMPAALFGRKAMGDPRFVFDLRRGREPRTRTEDRIKRFIEDYQEGYMQIDFGRDRQMASARRRTLRPQPWMPLLAALLRLAGERAELLHHGEKPWASITFAGGRHTVTLVFRGVEAVEAGERFIAALPEHEFVIPRHLVADATIVSAEHDLLPEPRLTVEAELLLLEEA